jgi:ribonuclease HI
METITIFTDGDSRGNPGPAAVGVQILDAQGTVLSEVSETIGNATNDFAEYQAVLRALQTAVELFDKKTSEMQFELKLDSELVQQQLSGERQIKEVGLVPHFIEIHNMRVASFPNLIITYVCQESNRGTNRLVSEALDAYGLSPVA